MEPIYLTTDQLAKILDLKIVTIRRMIARKEIPAYFVATEYRVHKQDFERFMNSHKIQ